VFRDKLIPKGFLLSAEFSLDDLGLYTLFDLLESVGTRGKYFVCTFSYVKFVEDLLRLWRNNIIRGDVIKFFRSRSKRLALTRQLSASP
jgi:hypothetical protein